MKNASASGRKKKDKHESRRIPGRIDHARRAGRSGKTSNVDYLAEQIRALGFEVVLTRQPGGSLTAEQIRHVLVGMPHTEEPMTPIAEILLYAASRNQVIESVIKPALREGKVVISDRHYDSSYAYQGWGRGFLEETIAIERIANQDFQPDFTLFFDVSFDTALERLQARKKEFNRLNAEDVDFRQRCFDGYQERYNAELHRMYRIDAMQTPEEVRNQVRTFSRNTFLPWLVRHVGKVTGMVAEG